MAAVKTSPHTSVQCNLYFLVTLDHRAHLNLFENRISLNQGLEGVISVARYIIVHAKHSLSVSFIIPSQNEVARGYKVRHVRNVRTYVHLLSSL